VQHLEQRRTIVAVAPRTVDTIVLEANVAVGPREHLKSQVARWEVGICKYVSRECVLRLK